MGKNSTGWDGQHCSTSYMVCSNLTISYQKYLKIVPWSPLLRVSSEVEQRKVNNMQEQQFIAHYLLLLLLIPIQTRIQTHYS